MNNDMNVALVLSLKDKLVGPLARAVSDIEREFKDLERSAKQLSSTVESINKNLAGMARQRPALSEAARGMGEIERNADSAQRKVSLLERATSKLAQAMRGVSGLRGAFNTGAAGVAGFAAFDHVVADPLKRAAEYDMRLRYMVSTAYRGQPLPVKQAKIKEIDAAITNAVRTGGGSREDVSDALEHLIKSAAFGGVDENIQLLPALTRTGTASGASASEMAQLAIALKRNLGIGVDKLPLALGRVLVASQMGSFKVSDTAQHIAELAPGLRLAGMTGMGALNELLAMDEAAVDTAGSPGQAATNVAQMLKDEMAPFTQRFFRMRGIDLHGSVERLMSTRGMSSHQAFLAVADQMSRSDPKYRSIQDAYEHATDESGRKAALESMMEYQKGIGLGAVFHNTEAMRAIMAQLTQYRQVEKIMNAIAPSQDANVLKSVGDTFSFVSGGAGYTYAQRQFEEQHAQTEALGEANGSLKKLAQAQIDLYQRYPGFASALEGAKLAVEGLTGALAAMGVMKLVTGGKLPIPTGAAPAGELNPFSGVGGGVATTVGVSWGARMLGVAKGLGIAGLGYGAYQLDQAYPTAYARAMDEASRLPADQQKKFWADYRENSSLGGPLGELVSAIKNFFSSGITLNVDGEQMHAAVAKTSARDARRQ